MLFNVQAASHSGKCGNRAGFFDISLYMADGCICLIQPFFQRIDTILHLSDRIGYIRHNVLLKGTDCGAFMIMGLKDPKTRNIILMAVVMMMMLMVMIMVMMLIPAVTMLVMIMVMVMLMVVVMIMVMMMLMLVLMVMFMFMLVVMVMMLMLVMMLVFMLMLMMFMAVMAAAAFFLFNLPNIFLFHF